MRRLAALLALCLLCLALPTAAPVRAAACSWTGASSTDWNTDANWSCGRVPGAGDTVTVDVFGATITLPTAVTIDSLLIRRGSISGAGSLHVTGLTQLDVGFETIINTNGSRMPQLEIISQGAIVRLTDPALTSDSLQSLTLRGGSTVLQVGDRSIGALTLGLHPLTATTPALLWSGTLTVTQSMASVGGMLARDSGGSGSASLIVSPAATLALSGGTIVGASLINRSDTVVSLSTFPMLSGSPRAQLINEGVFELRAPGDLQVNGSGDLINRGTMRKFNGGQVVFGAGMAFRNDGLLEVGAGSLRFNDSYTQYAGELRLSGGNVQGNSQFTQFQIRGGAISGSGVITSGIQLIGGTMAPTGTLTILGAYQQSPTSTLRVMLRGPTPGVDFGRVRILPNQNIGGGASIAGRLQIDAASGFQPASGDRFQVMTCSTSCQGSFSTASGNLTPTFGGFAGNGEVVIAEPQAAALVGILPNNAVMHRNETNGYLLKIVNPTAQQLSISSLMITLPISFTYQIGSTSGVLMIDPTDTPLTAHGTRRLSWSAPIGIPAGGSAELRFRIGLIPTIDIGTYPLDLQLQAGAAPISYTGVAPLTIPLDAVQSLAIGTGGAGSLNTATNPPTLLVSRAALASGLRFRTRIVCPFTNCGQLLAVYIEHGGKLLTMQAAPAQQRLSGAPGRQSGDYGFWDGYISPENVFPGEPTRIFPDWENHRACIYYDYGGGGGRPMGCVPGGDPGPTPQLYDPSGVVTNATTGQPIVGATVTLFRIPGALPDTAGQTRDCRTLATRGGGVWTGTAPDTGVAEDATLQPKQIEPQVNPQVTGSDGRYGWNVVTGCWYVRVSAPGYLSKTSALVGVPPEVTDLDIALQPDPAAGGQYSINLPVVIR